MDPFWSFCLGLSLSESSSEDEDSSELELSWLDESLLDEEEGGVSFCVDLARITVFPLVGAATFPDDAFPLSESLDESLLDEEEVAALGLLRPRI